jgi:hypothetical protein
MTDEQTVAGFGPEEHRKLMRELLCHIAEFADEPFKDYDDGSELEPEDEAKRAQRMAWTAFAICMLSDPVGLFANIDARSWVTHPTFRVGGPGAERLNAGREKALATFKALNIIDDGEDAAA